MAKDQPRFAGLDVAVTVLGVGAALLPIAGFLVREWAFNWGLAEDSVLPLALAASVGLLAWTGFWALILSAPAIVLIVLLVRVAPVISAIQRVLPARLRAIEDATKAKASFEAVRADLEAAADRQERGELSAEEEKEYSAKGKAILKQLDSVDTEIDKLTASSDWKVLTEAPPEARVFARAMSWLDRFPSWPAPLLAVLLAFLEILFLPDWPGPLIAQATLVAMFAAFMWTRQAGGRLSLLA